MSRRVRVGNTNFKTGSTFIVEEELHELTTWDHSWSLEDARPYIPSAEEQSAYGIDASLRVEFVPDRGTGNMPLHRDRDVTGVYQFMHPEYGPLPGPLWIPECERFNGYAGCRFDYLHAGLGPGMFSMLLPNTLDADTSIGSGDPATYFNGGAGFTPPYWVSMLVRTTGVGRANDNVWDSVLGGAVGGAGPTVTAGDQLGGGTAWTIALWETTDPPPPPIVFVPSNTFETNKSASEDETIFISFSVSASGTNCGLTMGYPDSAGNYYIYPTISTLNPYKLNEVFFGWVHECYLAFATIQSGTPNFSDILRTWEHGRRYCPPRATLAEEP